MSRIKKDFRVASGFLTRMLAIASVLLVALAAQPAQAQQDGLSFFKSYFITGDYVVRGTSLWRKGVNGKAVADIPKIGGADGVTPDADILAAFLYIQTAEKIQGSGIDRAQFGATPAAGKPFFGNDFGPFFAAGSNVPGSGTIAKALNWEQATVPCWSVLFPGGGRRLVTYRTDVLRFLPIDKKTGKQALNTSFRVVIPDTGIEYADDDENSREREDRNGPRAVGVSLVVVYRDPAKPYKAVVIYDGGVTKRALNTLTQTVQGFYDASAGTPVPQSAKMTHIVGDGRPLLSERVTINSQVFNNPFKSADGAKWDNWTTPISLPAHASSASVRVDPLPLIPDCLSWSAMVLSTNVQDTDGDGLLDRWEMSPPPTDASDPTNRPLPDLGAMGANYRAKDVFVEIGYLHTGNLPMSYGGVPKPAHSHLPTEDALNLVGKAFADAPVTNPDGSSGIKIHFDVGNNYQGSPYVIPAWLARGGEGILETACDATDPKCQYPNYPGTVGWKTGFRRLRDQITVDVPQIPGQPDACDLPGNACERRFDRNRRDMFRYALFAHSLGLPKEPCLNPDGSANALCQTTNALFKVPRTNSGIADFPGGDLMVTLGAFDDTTGSPIGKPFMQASTLAHELGHTFELTHSGVPLVPREPNCKPNYLSVMNYLFQLRGLINEQGEPVLDFSSQRLPALNEFTLQQGLGLGLDLDTLTPAKYRTGWYAPQATSYLKNLAAAATGHCDGSPLLKDVNGNLLEPPMVRLDATSAAGAIDWNANGDTLDTLAAQDLNFNGFFNTNPNVNPAPPLLNAGSNDWQFMLFNQVGGRRNVGGIYADPAANGRKTLGPLSLDVGRSDIGRSDIGRSDIGRSDIGRSDIGRSDIGNGDLGRGDIGRSDIGRSDIGRSDIGRGDFGGGDLDVGGPNEPVGELDLETFKAAVGNTPTPPNTLQACLTDDSECATPSGGRPVRLDWQAPNVGRPVAYSVYRFEFAAEPFVAPATLPTTPIAVIMPFEGGVLPTTYFDAAAYGDAKFAYFVTAKFDDNTLSGISNFATVTTPPAELPEDTVLAICGDQDPRDDDPLIFNCERFQQLPNLQLYQVPASAAQLKLDFVYRGAGFNNEVVAFKVDDAIGSIGTLRPGEPGYLAAALARSKVIFASGSDASAYDVTLSSLPVTGALHGGDRLVFFIVQDSTLAALKSANPNNLLSGAPLAFFSLNSLNPDAYDHVFAFSDSYGTTEFGFEDLTFGGDQDFEDVVFTVKGVNP